METYYAKGKLLLTGEYLVLDGAQALACPTQTGQKLTVKEGRGSDIRWTSLDPEGQEWFSAVISLFDFACEKTSDPNVGLKLTDILTEAVRLNSDFLSKWKKYKIETTCEFPLDWGLGSSSTLVYCIAQWADVDPFELYKRTFGGSGYDIACADAKGPIFYHVNEEIPEIVNTEIPKAIRDHLFFIYTGRKQNTQSSIQHYRDSSTKIQSKLIDDVSAISNEFTRETNLNNFNSIINQHESIISEILKLPKIQDEKFSDYWGAVKSLGAWGGDFIMATSDRTKQETAAYFNQKGHDIVITCDEMLSLQSEE